MKEETFKQSIMVERSRDGILRIELLIEATNYEDLKKKWPDSVTKIDKEIKKLEPKDYKTGGIKC